MFGRCGRQSLCQGGPLYGLEQPLFRNSRRKAAFQSSERVLLGQLPLFDYSSKQSSERLLNSETCRMTHSHNSAIPADGVYSIEWSVWRTLPTLAALPA